MKGAWLAVGLVLAGGVVAVVALRSSSSAAGTPPAGDLRFAPAAGWTESTTGMHPQAPQVPTASAANVPLQDPPGSIPHETLRDLPPTGIVILAATYVPLRANEDAKFPERALPLDVRDADVRQMWEGQPDRDVPEYLSLQRVNGFDLEVRIYFGTQTPDNAVVSEAQAELERLVVPVRES